VYIEHERVLDRIKGSKHESRDFSLLLLTVLQSDIRVSKSITKDATCALATSFPSRSIATSSVQARSLPDEKLGRSNFCDCDLRSIDERKASRYPRGV